MENDKQAQKNSP